MTARSRERHVDDNTRTHRRPTTAPFVGQWALWFVALPAIGTFLWWVGQDLSWCIQLPDDTACRVRVPLAPNRPDVRVLAAGGAVFVTCAVSTVSAVVGVFVTKRHAVVVTHVAAAWVWAGLAVLGTTAFGWSWVWFVAHTVISAIGAFGWNVYKADALRSDRGEKEKVEAADGLSKLVGLPRAVVHGQPQIDDHFITAEIDPGMGKTHGDVDGAMEAIEQQVKPALSGRSWTEYNPVTKMVRAVFMHKDPLTPWPLWQGPSNMGGSFEAGAVCGMYADAQPERIRLAKWHNPATDEDVMASGIASTGITRSGKSGHGAVLWTDIALTTCDAGMVYLDGAKPGQSLAGQVMEDLVLFAQKSDHGSIAPMLNLLDAIGSRLVPYRSRVLGNAGYTDWSHRAFLETGIAALLVVCDEGDLIASSKRFRDMVTKCLSVGVFFHLLAPRLDAESVDSTARTAIGQTLAFGQGDDYSDDMALTDVTKRRLGKKLYNWGNRYPGYHVYDGAGGVDENRWAMDVRSLKATFAELKPAIVAGRSCRANGGRVLTPGEIATLGKDWGTYAPPGGRYWERAGIRSVEQPAAEMEPTDYEGRHAVTESDDPYNDKDWRNADPDEDIPVPLPDVDDREPGDVEYYSDPQRTNPVPDAAVADPADDEPWPDAKPKAPNRTAAREELHRAVRALPNDLFTNAELIEEYRYRASEGWFSEFLYALDRGETIVPGITITNAGRGTWRRERSATAFIDGAQVPQPVNAQ